MAQVPFNSCSHLNRARQDLRPPDLGAYTVVERQNPGCLPFNKELPRRNDVALPHWGGGGAPKQDVKKGQDTIEGVGAKQTRELASYATEIGPIALAFGRDPDNSYMPSIKTLEAAPYYDTRATAISDRYYR